MSLSGKMKDVVRNQSSWPVFQALLYQATPVDETQVFIVETPGRNHYSTFNCLSRSLCCLRSHEARAKECPINLNVIRLPQ